MSLVPSNEDRAFSDGYRNAAEAGGVVIDHLSKRLREVEVERDNLKDDYLRQHHDAIDRWEALKQIAIVCETNAGGSCTHKMALDFVRQVATKALNKKTTPTVTE